VITVVFPWDNKRPRPRKIYRKSVVRGVSESPGCHDEIEAVSALVSDWPQNPGGSGEYCGGVHQQDEAGGCKPIAAADKINQ
jgi:hypothetical protein